MKTILHQRSLQKSGILQTLKVEPGPRKDLLILPDVHAARQIRKIFASSGKSDQFITTFGALAQKHNLSRPDRRQILSRTGRAILMRKAVENIFGNENPKEAKLSDKLLRLNANLKQSGVNAGFIAKRGKGKMPNEISAKLARFGPVLTEFESLMKASGMLDDTDTITDLADAVEKGDADCINGRARRIIAAGFHRLTPSHLKVMQAAEKAGMQALVLVAEPYGGSVKTGEQPTAGNTKVFLVSFPHISTEAEFAASEIRRMVDCGKKIEDFAVIVRNLVPGGAIIADAFERNGVPVALRSGAGLGAASAISVLLRDFLACMEADSGGKAFVRLLRNRMLKPFFSGVGNLFETVSKMESALGKTGSRDQADGDLFKRMTEPLSGARGFTKALEKITELKEVMSANLTADGGRLKASEVFSGLAALVDITGASKASPRDGSIEEAREFLREAVFLSEKWDCEVASPAEFSGFMEEIISGRTYSRKTRSDGPCVPVMNALQARGTSYPVVFVLDFSERSFPQPPPAQTILNDEERRLINLSCGAEVLTTNSTHLSDERLIWKSVSACADEELHISFSRNGAAGDGGRSVSHFMEELGEYFTVPEEEKKGSNVLISEQRVYSPETARAAAFASEGEIPRELDRLLGENDPLSHLADTVGAGIAAEKERLRADGNFCRFEGIVKKPEDGWWRKLRVSDIEKFGTCPFMFFCSNILGIKEKRESGEIPEASDTGSLYHAVLKHLFSSATDRKIWEISGEETGLSIQEFLDREETKDLHCRTSDEVWELQKERTLRTVGRFVEFEKKRTRNGNLTPKMFERDVQVSIAGAEVRGRLDRMDIGPEGGACVVDYKKGSVESKNFYGRENLQVPVYLAEISRELRLAPERGAYLSVERPWEKNERTARGKNGIPIDAAMEFLRNGIDLIKRGFFAPVPVKKPDGFPYGAATALKKTDRPCGFCNYSDICRVKDGTLRTAETEKR